MNFMRKRSFFVHSHQPDSLEMDFSNQPDNLYYLNNLLSTFLLNFSSKDMDNDIII